MGLNGQGVDVTSHELPDHGIDEAMPGHGRKPPERLGDDLHAKMAEAPGSPRMAGMLVALVLDHQLLR